MLAQEIDDYEYDYQSQYNKPKEAFMKGRSPRMSIGETRSSVLNTPAGAASLRSPNIAQSSKSAPEVSKNGYGVMEIDSFQSKIAIFTLKNSFSCFRI